MYASMRSTPAPGSIEEADALAAIDAARDDELAALDERPSDRQRRAQQHWRRRDRQLRGW